MEMDLSTKLKEKGWHITEGGLTKLQALAAAPGATTVQKLIEIAMNLDMREIGGGALALKRNGKLLGSIVLQISKIRNISAPKSNEESKVAPRTLQIELTDGQQNIFAIELEHNPALNANIAPGTKVLLKQQRLNLLGAYIKLLRDDIQVLGGQVPALIEKWELARSMHQFSREVNRSESNAGPPAWVQFGRKLDANALPGHKNFKSLAATQTVKKNENESFNAFRSEAIAEASKQGSKKVFSAGQQIVDSNMKRILDKGYTEEEAKRVLMQTNNNLERAFSQLKRLKNSQNSTFDVNNKQQQQQRQLANNSKEVSKPTGNVTLSEFLADKLAITTPRQTETTEKMDILLTTTNLEKQSGQHVTILKNARKNNSPRRASTSATRAEQRKFENNMSSSFAESQRYKGGSHEHHSRHHARATENAANSTRAVYNSRSKRNGNEQQQQQQKQQQQQDNNSKTAANENFRQNGARQMKNRKPLANAVLPTNNNNNNNNKNVNNNNHIKTEQQQQQQKHHYNNNNHNNNKLENGEYQNRSQSRHTIEAPKQQQQQQQQHKSQNISGTQTRINNKNIKTDPYDSSKIIGFQSKETNELALNLLKSEGVNLKSSKQATNANAMSNPTIKPFKSIKNDYFTTTTTKENITVQQQQQHHQEKQQPQQQQFNRNPVAISKEEQLAAGYDNSFNEPWNWRVGDLCMAKYWDDGCYYRAEITAISDKTFVVYFVGYGNHEEVLKADCLPITDEEHRPINNYIDAENDDRNGVQAYLTTATNTNHRQRYERQVYVPPAKRSEI